MDTQSEFVPDWTPTEEDRDDDAGEAASTPAMPSFMAEVPCLCLLCVSPPFVLAC